MKASKKFFSRAALVQILKKKRHKKIVFTNGCFDLLHAGHVALLERSRRLGDLLVVGLNSDSSVRRIKGSKRPLVNEQARAKVLAGLTSVDYVTLFPEDTPLETIRMLRPDVLVKGGDYDLSEIVGRAAVKKVVRVPLVKNLSTTKLIQKILAAYGGKNKSSA